MDTDMVTVLEDQEAQEEAEDATETGRTILSCNLLNNSSEDLTATTLKAQALHPDVRDHRVDGLQRGQ